MFLRVAEHSKSNPESNCWFEICPKGEAAIQRFLGLDKSGRRPDGLVRRIVREEIGHVSYAGPGWELDVHVRADFAPQITIRRRVSCQARLRALLG